MTVPLCRDGQCTTQEPQGPSKEHYSLPCEALAKQDKRKTSIRRSLGEGDSTELRPQPQHDLEIQDLVATLHGMHFTGRVFLDYAEMLEILRFLAARLSGRHILAYLLGLRGDSHLANAACRLLFALALAVRLQAAGIATTLGFILAIFLTSFELSS